jgi:predicted nucleic acid-binding protein
MNAVDTNVLIYAHDPRDATKNSIATSLIDSLVDGLLLWQVACEFLWASRKLVPFGYDQQQAWGEILRLRLVWRTVAPDWSVMDRASTLLTNYSLSFWDALIIAACLDCGVTSLYSEDFDSYPKIEGLSLINPFKAP